MYITIFTRVDGKPAEEYPYRTIIEAEKHLDLFRKDDSGIYKSIAVLDDVTDTILSILVFNDGVPGEVIRHNDIVRFKPEFCSDSERHLLFAVKNINEKTHRCVVVCINSGQPLPSSETVGLEMIRLVSKSGELNLENIVP